MKTFLKIFIRLTVLALIYFNLCLGQSLRLDSYVSAKKDFTNPSIEYSTAPFLIWNYFVTRPVIDQQLELFKEIGINQVIVHPRVGMVTEYLSKEWFDLIKYTVAKAKKMNMKVILYDENSYPSGFGGGHVPSEAPETIIQHMNMVTTMRPDTVKNIFAVFERHGDEFQQIDKNNLMKDAQYEVFYTFIDKGHPFLAGFQYVDLLQKQTTLKFLNIIHEKYKKAVGNEFGKTIPSIFTDEPSLKIENVPYSPGIFEGFQKKYNYDIVKKLPLLIYSVGDYRKVRHDIYTYVLDLYVEGWAKPYSKWCKKNHIALTGHYWEHSWGNSKVPDNMALISYNDIPGIDVLLNVFSNKSGSQFGNDMMVRDSRSVVNQMGKERMISETYGAAGWDLSFQDMKRIGDYQYALGVNQMTQHLCWQSITGYRKYDYPPSFSYHAPYIKDYKYLADYYSRLSAGLSKGIQNNRIVMLEPTTTTRMYFRSPEKSYPRDNSDTILNKYINSFHSFVHEMETLQVEYDLASEYLIREYGSVDKNNFIINKCKYSLFILPPFTENLESRTFELLESYLKNGGKILSTNILPKYIDAAPSDKVIKLAQEYPQNWITVEKITPESIKNLADQGISFTVNAGRDKLYHMRKELSDAQLVFVANINEKDNSEGNFIIKGGSVEKWDVFTGKTEPYPFERAGETIKVGFKLAPGNSVLLCIKNEKKEPVSIPEYKLAPVLFTDEVKIERHKPNMLTIDYCDLRFENQEYKGMYFYDAMRKVFGYYGYPDNPWNGIQFKTQLIDRKFDAASGYEVDYKFFVETSSKSLQAVYERPEISKIKINGNPIEAIKGKWFVDKDFGVYDISKYVKQGENTITVTVKPMKILGEIDRLYIIGDFSLVPKQKGFGIVDPKPMKLGDWTKQGMQFYSDNVSYKHTLELKELKGMYQIKLPDWKGTVAEISVNGKLAGLIAIDPYELDITKFLHKGKNNIKVTVVSSLRNLLGPHHDLETIGQTWPHQFMWVNDKQGLTLSGDSYVFVPYGLMEDFELINIR